MKYRIILALLAFSATTLGCSTTKYEVRDEERIDLETNTTQVVQTAVKDFKVIQPVFAQTTLNETEDLTDYDESSNVSNASKKKSPGYDAKSGEAEKLRKVARSGSKIIERRLYDEAFKVGADAIVNIHIETEKYCHEQSVIDEKETQFNAQAMLKVMSSLAGVAGGIAGASGADPVALSALSTSSSSASQLSGIAPNSQSIVKNESKKEVCTITIYGNALAIKYTDAIVPVCSGK